MQANDGGRYTGSSNAYSPNMRRPAGQGGGGKRTALKIAACLLLPPVAWCGFGARVRLRCAAG